MDPTTVTENWWQWIAGIGVTFITFLIGIARHMYGKIDEARDAAEKADAHIWTAITADRADNAKHRENIIAQVSALPTRQELNDTANRIIEEVRARK